VDKGSDSKMRVFIFFLYSSNYIVHNIMKVQMKRE